MRVMVLGLLACAACATLDTSVVNENYDPPTHAQTRARAQTAMDLVRHGEDPCADQSDRPAIENVVHTEEGDDEPVPDDGSGCKVWGPARLTSVTVKGASAFAWSLLGDREVASFDRDGTLFRHGLTGNQEEGEVRCGKLVRFGLAEDRIVARIEAGAVIGTGLFNQRYARAAPCSDNQAAVGAFALMVLAEESAQQDERDKAGRDAKRREVLQQQHDDQMRRMRDERSPGRVK